MKKKYYFGSNLKMYKTVSETMNYLHSLEDLTGDISREKMELFILPSFISLDRAINEIDPDLIRIGAQTMFWEDEGQYTGEISPVMLCSMGIRFVMVGHSERRNVFRESNMEEGYRMRAALHHKMTALLCVGESLVDKEKGIAKEVIMEQMKTGLFGITPDNAAGIRIAYEPGWAIGTAGKPAEPFYIESIHEMIKETLLEMFHETAENVPVLYGGSVNLDNAVSYAQLPAVDGLFIGRSAWEADKFNKLLREVLLAES